jgi:hypothetical protein
MNHKGPPQLYSTAHKSHQPKNDPVRLLLPSGKPVRTAVLLLSCFLLALAGNAPAADWPHYLGPNYNKTSTARIQTNWAAKPPRELWRKSIGQGWSGIVVSKGCKQRTEKVANGQTSLTK